MWRPDEDCIFAGTSAAIEVADQYREEQLQQAICEENEANDSDHEQQADDVRHKQTHKILQDRKNNQGDEDKSTSQQITKLQQESLLATDILLQEMRGVDIMYDSGDLSSITPQTDQFIDDSEILVNDNGIPIFRADRYFQSSLKYPERAGMKAPTEEPIISQGPIFYSVPLAAPPIAPPPGMERPLPPPKSKNKKKGKKTKFKPAPELLTECPELSIGPDCSDVCNIRQAMVFRKFNR